MAPQSANPPLLRALLLPGTKSSAVDAARKLRRPGAGVTIWVLNKVYLFAKVSCCACAGIIMSLCEKLSRLAMGTHTWQFYCKRSASPHKLGNWFLAASFWACVCLCARPNSMEETGWAATSKSSKGEVVAYLGDACEECFVLSKSYGMEWGPFCERCATDTAFSKDVDDAQEKKNGDWTRAKLCAARSGILLRARLNSSWISPWSLASTMSSQKPSSGAS